MGHQYAMAVRLGWITSPCSMRASVRAQVAFLGFIFQHAAYPGKGPIQNLVVSYSPFPWFAAPVVMAYAWLTWPILQC